MIQFTSPSEAASQVATVAHNLLYGDQPNEQDGHQVVRLAELLHRSDAINSDTGELELFFAAPDLFNRAYRPGVYAHRAVEHIAGLTNLILGAEIVPIERRVSLIDIAVSTASRETLTATSDTIAFTRALSPWQARQAAKQELRACTPLIPRREAAAISHELNSLWHPYRSKVLWGIGVGAVGAALLRGQQRG